MSVKYYENKKCFNITTPILFMDFVVSPERQSRPFAQMPVSKQQPTTRNVVPSRRLREFVTWVVVDFHPGQLLWCHIFVFQTAGLRLPKTMKLDSPTPVFPVIHSSHPTTSSSITATSSSGSVSVKSLTINTMHAHHNNSFSLESIDDIPARLPVDPELEVYQRKRQVYGYVCYDFVCSIQLYACLHVYALTNCISWM